MCAVPIIMQLNVHAPEWMPISHCSRLTDGERLVFTFTRGTQGSGFESVRDDENGSMRVCVRTIR